MIGWCCFQTAKKPTDPQPDPPQEIPRDECSDASPLDHGYSDLVLEEIWAIRDKHGEEVGYDMEKLVQVYREYQKKLGDELIPAPEYKKADRPAA
ncbi:MAG TPA: hypothetical protein VFS20_33750 [Longimicrobium sp.]|nr:hypothetical protein [Longimicrobium sp.]